MRVLGVLNINSKKLCENFDRFIYEYFKKYGVFSHEVLVRNFWDFSQNDIMKNAVDLAVNSFNKNGHGFIDEFI